MSVGSGGFGREAFVGNVIRLASGLIVSVRAFAWATIWGYCGSATFEICASKALPRSMSPRLSATAA